MIRKRICSLAVILAIIFSVSVSTFASSDSSETASEPEVQYIEPQTPEAPAEETVPENTAEPEPEPQPESGSDAGTGEYTPSENTDTGSAADVPENSEEEIPDGDNTAESAENLPDASGEMADEIEDASEVEEALDIDEIENPGVIRSMLAWDDVSGSVAEAGYFPSKAYVLSGASVYSCAMMMWFINNGAGYCRVKNTTVFSSVLGGYSSYTPQAGDLIYYSMTSSDTPSTHNSHVGIVAEVGADYITTIEGNVGNKVSKITYTSSWYSSDLYSAWIINVFGDDADARSAYVDTAWQAYYDCQDDLYNGEAGFSSWIESYNHNGEGQNNTIASGYFGFAAEWCQMFVLWCAFNADIVRTEASSEPSEEPTDEPAESSDYEDRPVCIYRRADARVFSPLSRIVPSGPVCVFSRSDARASLPFSGIVPSVILEQ